MIKRDLQIVAGVAIHCTSLVLNVLMTYMAMTRWPSQDSWWTGSGFCVVEHDTSIPTELLCFTSLTSSAVAAWILVVTKGREMERDYPLLLERIKSSIFGNVAHGVGHYFLWAMGLAAPPLELSLRPAAIASMCMLLSFWIGTLRNVVRLPVESAGLMATLVLAAQYLMNVPPELVFTYSQSIIILCGSLEQLGKRDEYYLSMNKSDSLVFFATSLYHLPLFVLYYLEMFSCSESFLSWLGGHAVYDFYLSAVPFVLYSVVTSAGRNDKATIKKTI